MKKHLLVNKLIDELLDKYKREDNSKDGLQTKKLVRERENE